jgi:hypothetical protein
MNMDLLPRRVPGATELPPPRSASVGAGEPPTGTVAALLATTGRASTGVHHLAATPETSPRAHVAYPLLVDLAHAWAMHPDAINAGLPMRTPIGPGDPCEQGFAESVAAWLDNPTPVGRPVIEGVVLPPTGALDMAAIAELADEVTA